MRKVLITGGTGLIGKTLIRSMLSDGHFVFCTSRSFGEAKKKFKEQNIISKNLDIIECDFFESKSEEKILKSIPNDIDSVIFNARSMHTLKIGQNGMLSDAQWQDEIRMAVIFPYQLIKLMINDNRKIKDVLFISSIYGKVAPNPALYDNYESESPINYGVAKAAQIHLTKEMSIRFIRYGVRTNCILFGGVKGRTSNDFEKRYNLISPIGRMNNENDLYPAIKLILDNPNLAINGENIKIDGGWTNI